MNYELMVQAYAALVEPVLSQSLLGIVPALREAMGYSLLAPGKRLRPVLLLASCEAVGGDARKATAFAAALEMIHAYSLIHDDLPCMDDDDLRRGQPTNHKVYGEGMAVLAGDGLLSLAFETMAQQVIKAEDPIMAAQAMAAIARGCGTKGMVSGQARDLTAVGQQITDNDLRLIHSEKTCALITAACVAGAILGGATGEQRKALETYGQHLGMAFQITDDVLDHVGDAQTLGKTPGKDEAQDKPTYVSLFGLAVAKRWAARMADLAVDALEPLGKQGAFLKKMAISTVIRVK